MINFDDPFEMESYFHRIGRTARFGRYGASFLMMTEDKFNTFIGNKQYTYSINKLLSEDDLIHNAVAINEKLAILRKAMDEEVLDKNAALDQAIRTMGTDALIGQWIEGGKSADNTKYRDIGQYRYAPESIDEVCLEDIEKLSDVSSSVDYGVEEVEAEIMEMEYEEGEAPEKRAKTDLNEDQHSSIPITKTPLEIENSQKNTQYTNPITTQQNLFIPSQVSASKRPSISYSMFSRLVDLLNDPCLRSILNTTVDHCDVDLRCMNVINDLMAD